MIRKLKFLGKIPLLHTGNILKWSSICKKRSLKKPLKSNFQKKLKSITLACFHLVTSQLDARQCRHCFSFSWQQKYLGCAITYGAIWWEIIQPAEHIGRQPPQKQPLRAWSCKVLRASSPADCNGNWKQTKSCRRWSISLRPGPSRGSGFKCLVLTADVQQKSNLLQLLGTVTLEENMARS